MFRVIAVSAVTAIGGVLLGTATDVRAQTAGDPIVRTGEGSGNNNDECPDGEGPTAIDFASTAVGCQAEARNNRDTAVGFKATANSVGTSGNPTTSGGATAVGMNSSAKGQNSVAIGRDAQTTSNEGIAIGGRNEQAAKDGEQAKTTAALQGISIGSGAVTQERGVAIGTRATAHEDATAIGDHARAIHDGAVVIGTDSTSQINSSTRENQFLMGTENHTYTAPGITSDASKAAQEDSGSGEIEIVTTDQQGDLATISMSDIGASQQQVDQNTADIAETTQGVAIAIAMDGPDLAGNETFAVAANWGTFEGVNAFAASATGVLSQDVFTDGSGVRLSASGGIGYSPSQDGADDSVAGRAGVQLSW